MLIEYPGVLMAILGIMIQLVEIDQLIIIINSDLGKTGSGINNQDPVKICCVCGFHMGIIFLFLITTQTKAVVFNENDKNGINNYIFRLYCPPVSNKASEICPMVQ